ncbi:MAG: extracellular solute-binding protein [Lachnoclostridium sp.]|nr:extracellular solute-binding protein [Lachnospira sp.]MCM1248525.1 extracellular solute-binding protein [Lachnoclostridium sp.]MCM1535313.1 extracellular solute-binding protein [Clostridium sp.]
MKNFKHKIIAMAVLFAFVLAGCGKTKTDVATGQNLFNNNNNNNPASGEKAVSWEADYSRLDNLYSLATATEHAVCGCYAQDGRVMVDWLPKDGNADAKKSFELAGASLIAGMAADGEGNIYLLGKQEKEKSTGLWEIDAEGNLQDYVELVLEDTERAVNIFLKGIYADSEGMLFVWCTMEVPETEMIEGYETEVWHEEDRVYVKDAGLQTVFYEKIAEMMGRRVLAFQMGTDGSPIFVVRDSDGIYLQEIDVAQKKRKNAVRLEKSKELTDAASENNLEYIAPTENGFLYCQNGELFAYTLDTQKAERLLTLSAYGVFSEDILFLAKNQKGMEIIGNHGDSEYSELVSFTTGGTEKTLLTLGTLGFSQELEKTVGEFNRYSHEYRVEIAEYYSQVGSFDEALEKLKLDVVTGKAPDIIDVQGIDYSMFSDKGVLADLYDFMEGDEELTKDMLVPSVAKAYESGGHLYSMAPSFQLYSMWGYGDVTKGKSGVTFEELFRLLKESGKDLNAILGFTADEPVLNNLCAVSMDEFVDWEKGTCSFDGDYFKEVLSFAKEYTGNYTGGTEAERIGKREAVMSVGIISGVSEYQIQKEIYGGHMAFIGYPVAEGSGTAVTFRSRDIAINARKENQAGAWAFVKFYLLHGYDGQGFPVLQEQFDRVLAEAMVDDYDMAEDGIRRERIAKNSYSDGVVSISVYAATEEEVDVIRKLVEGAENKITSHTDIQNIIREESEAYFLGQVDLDKTVEKIQNRVSLLLQEMQ